MSASNSTCLSIPFTVSLDGLFLSPLERRIIAALEGRAWTRAADLVGIVDDGDCRAIARNMVGRAILARKAGGGADVYRLRE